MMSNKLQETINIALNEDLEEMGQLANEKMPNVYIENPELITKESNILIYIKFTQYINSIFIRRTKQLKTIKKTFKRQKAW